MPKQPKGLSKEEKAVANDIEQAISSNTLGVRANPVNSDTVPSKWLNPDYKLNKNEIKQAKQIINEFNKNDARQGVRNGVVWGETPEARAEGERIQALQNKINPAASFTSGMLRRATNLVNGAVESIPSALRSIPKAIQNIPALGEEIVNAGSSDWINDQQKEEGTKPFINAKESLKNATAGMEQNLNNVANDIEPAINKAVENSKLNMKNVETQNPLAYGAGDAAEQMTEQIMWGGLLPEIPGLNPHVSNMITGQIADNLVQIGPDTLEKYNNGMRGNDLVQEVLKDEAENALWNVGGEFVIPSLFNGIGKGINAIANKNTAQAAEDVVENAAKSAPEPLLGLPQNDIEGHERAIMEQIAKSQSGEMPTEQLINMGKTPQYLSDYGNVDLDVGLKQSKLKQLMAPKDDAKHLHGMTDKQVAGYAEDVNSPVAVYMSGKNHDTPVVVGNRVDDYNAPIVSAFDMNYTDEMNRLRSEYGKDNVAYQLNKARENNNMLFENKEKVDEIINRGLQSPKSNNHDLLSNSNVNQIDKSVNKVNYEKNIKNNLKELEMPEKVKAEVNNRIKGIDNAIDRINNAKTADEVNSILSEVEKTAKDTDNLLKKNAGSRIMNKGEMDEPTRTFAEAMGGRKIYISPEQRAAFPDDTMESLKNRLYFSGKEGNYKTKLYSKEGNGTPVDVVFSEIDDATNGAVSNFMKNNGMDPSVPENQFKGLVEYADSLKANKDANKVMGYTGGALDEWMDNVRKTASDKINSFGGEQAVKNDFDSIINARNSGNLDRKAYKTALDNIESRERDILKNAEAYKNDPEVSRLVKEVDKYSEKSWDNLFDADKPINVDAVKGHQKALDDLEEYMANNKPKTAETGLKQLNKPEVPEQKPVKSIKDNVETPDTGKLPLDLQFFADKAKDIEKKLEGMEDGEAKKSIKDALSDFWSRLTGVKTKEEAEQAWDSLSKTRTNTMAKSGDFTDYELKNVFPEADAKYLKEAETIPYEAAKQAYQKNPKATIKRYTQKFKSDKEAGEALGNAQDINGMYIALQDLTKQARATEDMAKRNELYAQARQISRNLYKTNHDLGRGVQANAKFSRTPERAIQNAQGFVEDAVEKALDQNPNLKKGIDEVSAEINNFLKDMDTKATNRKEIEDMITAALKKNKQVKSRIGKGDIQKIADAIMSEKQYVDVQKQLEFLSTGFSDVDANTLDKVHDIFEEAQKLNFNSKKRMDKENEAYALLASKIAPNGGTFRDKVDAWRYLAMLANPTTHLKNITGNFLFGKGMVSAKNSLAALIEEGADRVSKLAGKGGIERTKSILTPGDSGLIKAAESDGLENAWRDLSGNKYFNVGSEIDNAIPAFSNKNIIGRGINKASEFNTNLLNKEDELAVLDKYKTSLAGFLKANGADESIFKATDEKSQKLLESARAYAINQAQEAAFHQDSETARLMSQFSRTAKDSSSLPAKALGFVGDIVVPFKKTPINIVKSVYQYSPASLATVASDIPKLSKGLIKPAEFIDHISRTATGTAALAIGALLAQKGILKIGADKSDQEGSFDKQTGRQNVAIKFGDKYVGVSELIPAAAPLIWGATIYETMAAKKGKEDAANVFFSGLSAIANGVTDMTMLSGIADTLNSVRYAEDKSEVWEKLAIDTAGNAASQMLPTLGRKTNVTIDDTKRSTYSDKSGAAKTIDQETKYLQTKIPGLQQAGEAMKKSNIPALQKTGNRLALQPDIDVKGQVRESPGVFGKNDIVGRAIGNFASPVQLTKDTSTKYDDERRRLAKATDEQKVIPYIASSESKIDDYRLTPEEWTKYRKTRGQLREQVASAVIDSKSYKDMSDADKAAALVKVDSFTKAVAQSKYGKDISSENKELAKIYTKKGPEGVAEALITNAKTKGIMGDLSADKTSKALVQKGDYEGLKEYADTKTLMKQYGLDTDADTSAYIQKSSNPEQTAKDLANIKNNKISPTAYIRAKDYIPSLKSTDFITAYKEMNTDYNDNIKQDEVVDYANRMHLSESEMMTYWKAYGPKKAWKSIPKLKNGKWVKK